MNKKIELFVKRLRKELNSELEFLNENRFMFGLEVTFYKINELLEKLGFRFLGSGSSRMAFLEPKMNLVLKIELGEAKANKRESIIAQNLNKLPKEIQNYILKPIAWDTEKYRWILFPFVKEDKGLGLADEKETEIREIFRDYGIELIDLASFNIGFRNGKAVIFDYGYEINLEIKAEEGSI